MDIVGAVKGLASGLVAPVANIFAKKVERKMVKDEINGKVALARQNHETTVVMEASKWEVLSKEAEANSWKDEYVTLSVFTIFNAVIVGSVLSAFGFDGGALLVKGALDGANTLDKMDGTVGTLIEVVAYAALSIKFYKDVIR